MSWIDVPTISDAFIVNGGQLLLRWPIAAAPTCVGPGRPPRYETTYYTDYMIRYQERTYNVFDDHAKDAAE